MLTVSTGTFEFNFEFGRYKPVTGPTGPVNRNRWPAVWVNRSGKKTLGGGGGVQHNRDVRPSSMLTVVDMFDGRVVAGVPPESRLSVVDFMEPLSSPAGHDR